MHTEHEVPEDEQAGEGVAAVERALKVLSVFNAEEEALALAELARRTGLYKSTILRLSASLERAGFLRRLADGRYTIGPEPLRLAQIYQESFHVRDLVLPLLTEMSAKTGETASFYVRDGNMRVCLHRIEPARSVRHTLLEGARLTLDRGAAGTVLRAFGNRPDESLAKVRAQLWAASFGERDPDSAAAAAPVFGVGQQLRGALSLSAPLERFTPDEVASAVKVLLSASARLTRALGGDAKIFGGRRNESGRTPR